jgi:NTE family protein
MGAVVGGLYATGLEPAELEGVIRDIDWKDAFVDRPPRKDLSYRRKRDDDDFLVNFDVGLRDGRVRLPKGIIEGQKLSLILRGLTLPVSHVPDFDALPTPFRAVAADLVTGDTVVIANGDLAQAMRASMAAPGIFSPAEIDGRTLVDGGIAMNLPVQVAVDLGADMIIAVDVGFPLLAAEQIESAVDVSNQMLTILIERENRDQRALLRESDVLIQPDLGELGSTDFLAALDAIDKGYAAAVAATDRLRDYSVSPARYDQYVAARRDRLRPPGAPAFVRVVTDAAISPSVIAKHLETVPGEPLDRQQIATDVARVFGLGVFEQVDYRLVREGDETGLEIDGRAKTWGPGYLRFGIGFEEDFEGSGQFGVSARYIRTAVNPLGGEWRTNIAVGTELGLSSEFYQPLSFDLRYFVAPVVELSQRNVTLFEGPDELARYRLSNAEAGLFFGRELGNWAELRFGVVRGTGNARLKTGDPLLPNIDFNSGAYVASFGVDTLDDTIYPTRGSRYGLTWQVARSEVGSDARYQTLESSYVGYRTFGRHTLSLGLDFATTYESNDVIQEYFPLGGFLNLSGLERGALTGPHAGIARFVYQRRMGNTGGGLFEWPLYLGASVEAGNVWQQRGDISIDDLIVNGSLFLRFDTFLGPLFLAGGLSEDSQTSFYLFLGSAGR